MNLEEAKKPEESKLKWLWRNIFGSKTVWGVALIAASPFTGPAAPGLLKAGEILIGVGLLDKGIKNGGLLKGLIGGFLTKKGGK